MKHLSERTMAETDVLNFTVFQMQGYFCCEICKKKKINNYHSQQTFVFFKCCNTCNNSHNKHQDSNSYDDGCWDKGKVSFCDLIEVFVRVEHPSSDEKQPCSHSLYKKKIKNIVNIYINWICVFMDMAHHQGNFKRTQIIEVPFLT